jgi:hypothetical protein
VSFEQRPQLARGEDQPDRAKIRGEQAVPDRPNMIRWPALINETWAARQARFAPSTASSRPMPEKPSAASTGNRSAAPNKQRAYSLVERAAPECEIQAKATMQPARREQRELAPFAVGCPSAHTMRAYSECRP